MKVKFWGTRGSIAVPGKNSIQYGGNTTCLEITLQSGKKVIVDSGTGIRALGEDLNAGNNAVDILLLITHIHWDHVSGFPFFAPIHMPETKIAIDGFPSCMKGLAFPFDSRMGDGLFPVRFEELKAEISHLDRISAGALTIDDVVIDSIPLTHPQGGYGFRFCEGEKTLVFLTDNELSEKSLHKKAPIDYVSFCKNADLLILDAQYTPQEIANHRGWGHSDYLTAIQLAEKADAKKLNLFHHDPSRTDAELTEIVTHCRELAGQKNSDLVIDAAREGKELTC